VCRELSEVFIFAPYFEEVLLCVGIEEEIALFGIEKEGLEGQCRVWGIQLVEEEGFPEATHIGLSWGEGMDEIGIFEVYFLRFLKGAQAFVPAMEQV
jgi:hypothetical protein